MSDFATKSEKTHICLVHETWREKLAKDAITAASFIFLWSAGYFADSPALEWAGVAVGGLVLFFRAVLAFKQRVDNNLTPDQAREWLDSEFPKTPENEG